MQHRLQRGLTLEDLDYRKPTDLLCRMQALTEDLAPIDRALLQELFLQHLPLQVHMILTTPPSLTLNSLAQLADKFMGLDFPFVATVHRAPDPPPPSSATARGNYAHLLKANEEIARQVVWLTADVAPLRTPLPCSLQPPP